VTIAEEIDTHGNRPVRNEANNAVDDSDPYRTTSRSAPSRARVTPASTEPNWPSGDVSISSWQPVDLAPILRGESVTPQPSAFARDDGVMMLYPGRINLFMGETESCKSWAATFAAKQSLEAGAHVVYVDFEDTPEQTVERLRAVGATAEQITAGLTYVQPDSLFDDLARIVLEDEITAKGAPALAVVDGVTEAMALAGLSPDNGSDVAAFYASFPHWLARAGAAVVVVDHVTKNTDTRGRWAIGSERKISGLTGAGYAFDTIAPFGRGRTGKVKVTVSKDRCGYVRQHEGTGRVIAMLELRSWPDGGVTVSVGVPEAATEGPARPTHIMATLSGLIASKPGISTNQLRASVKCKVMTTTLALELLEAERYIRVEPGANRSKLHHPLRPFLAADRGPVSSESQVSPK
jgi:hypothetical protein